MYEHLCVYSFVRVCVLVFMCVCVCVFKTQTYSKNYYAAEIYAVLLLFHIYHIFSASSLSSPPPPPTSSRFVNEQRSSGSVV